MWKDIPECSGLHEPELWTTEWFDWFGGCNSLIDELDPILPDPLPPPEPPPPCKPSRGLDEFGKCWETVCTLDGPEFRPCFTTPANDAMRIFALRLTGRGYLVQIATESGIKVSKIALGKVKLAQLASAMLNGSKLPNVELEKIPSTFWAQQKKIVVKKLYP